MATKEFIGKYLSTEISRYLPGFQNIEPVDYLGLDPSRNMVNIIDDLPIGLSSITYFTREDFGGTAIYDLNAEIPMVDFLVSQEKIVSGLAFVTGAKWSIFDLQKYQLAQRNNSNIESRNPVSTKVEIMGNFLSETENNMVLYGASSRQCYGVFNQPDVTVSDQSALGGGNFYSLNSSQVYNYFLEWINAFVRQAKLSSTSAIEILMPERLKALLAKPYDDGTNPIQL
ncbi:MAG: hypothetical protein F6K34_01055, partial [Okeania sp. SIO4D6]|nr:hypothetical protein [Okeania sp. SIO4D6]